VDLTVKPMAPGEIRRFIERFGLTELLDRDGKAYVDAGLKYLKLSDAELLARSSASRSCSPAFGPRGKAVERRSGRARVKECRSIRKVRNVTG